MISLEISHSREMQKVSRKEMLEKTGQNGHCIHEGTIVPHQAVSRPHCSANSLVYRDVQNPFLT